MNTKLLLAVVASIGFASAASAADLAARTYTKAPEYVPTQVFSWTGFYVGGNFGGVFTGNDTFSAADPSDTLGTGVAPSSTVGRGTGETAGVQLGYNWQVAPNVLLGIEGGFSGAALKFSSEAHPFNTGGGIVANSNFTATKSVRSLASIRGRFGFVSGDWLFFGTAGWAWADTTMGGDITCPPGGCNPPVHAPFSGSFTRSGATFGGGIDYHVPRSQWILGLEYAHYNLGGASGTGGTQSLLDGTSANQNPCANGGTACVNYSSSGLNLNEVKFSASYKFGG